jgi:hypothetical protein
MRRSHVRKVAAPNNASRMNSLVEPSMIKANSAKVIFDRAEIRRVLTIAKDRFEFLLFHAALRHVLQT